MMILFICMMILGGAALYFATKPEVGFGYKGLAYKALGKKVWCFSNRLCGILLLVVGVGGSISYFALNQPSNRRFFWAGLLAALLCFLISDLVTIQRFKNK
ncbi:hypothetical protein [Enterococcus diestrammenae]|uniref:SdpI family protein n=1 Tax=Enterococcus diestrammenae TaxID=1155073 RepID=A0ABV0EZK3_9ENTE|nr:hypothetical protein [Enterococcus diestrammenae]KAF1295017.1 hypothetical protein BAU18_04835 [Enterococcus diestrammenae]